MPTTYTDVDRLIFERWDDTMGLLEAYEELQNRIQDVIGEVGERLARWASERGYEIETDAKVPECHAWKSTWLNRRRGDPVVYFTLSNFAPLGYRRVKGEHPWVWLCTEDLQKLRMKEAEREAFARQLRSRLGDLAKDWTHEDATDADYPLGKYLIDISDKDRVQLVAEPDRLYEFVTASFEQIFVLSDAVDLAIAQVSSVKA